MQMMIDTAADTTTLLRRAAKFLTEEADLRDADETPFQDSTALRPKAPAREVAPDVDTAAVFGRKLPAGLDGHGADPVRETIAEQLGIKPLQAPPPPPAAPAALEFDSAGIPWDARVHQTAKGKKTDETWKVKKGMDAAVVATIMAELRAAYPKIAPAAVNLAPPPPLTQVAPPPPADPATTGQPATLSPGSPTGVTAFRVLMQTITANTNTGKLTNDEVDAALKSVNLPARQLISLVQNPDKVQGVADYIAAVLATKG